MQHRAHQLQSSNQRHTTTTKRIKKRTRRIEQTQQPNKLRACLVFSSFALLLILWLIAVTYHVITMISSSSNDDVIMDGAGRFQSSTSSVSSVQSALFNNERRPPLISSTEHNVPLVAVSDGKSKSNNNTARNSSFLRRNNHNIIPSKNTTITSENQQHPLVTPPIATKPKLLSRNPNVILTSSTRGNLGPPNVLNQNPPGTNWIKDRWQAASDMGGTAIKGSHWVLLDFTPLLMNDEEEDVDVVESVGKDDARRRSGIQMTKIVLDWETAFATDYRIEGRMDRPTTLRSSLQHDSSAKGVDEEEWCVLYDGGKHHPATTINNNHKKHNNNNNKLQEEEEEEDDGTEFHESEYGQSPGVKQKLPLHILHTIEWTITTISLDNNEQGSGSEGNNVGRKSSGSCSSRTTSLFRYLRVFIRKPARGWGVSLWQVDVYGTIA